VTGDGPVLDVHHADHPDTRNARLVNGLSLLPRAHYDRLRARYGEHLVDRLRGREPARRHRRPVGRGRAA
jgi:hypothetical protein